MEFVCIQGALHVADSILKTSVALAVRVGLWIKPEVGARCPPALALSGHLWLLFLLLLEAACCGKFSFGTALYLLVNGNIFLLTGEQIALLHEVVFFSAS